MWTQQGGFMALSGHRFWQRRCRLNEIKLKLSPQSWSFIHYGCVVPRQRTRPVNNKLGSVFSCQDQQLLTCHLEGNQFFVLVNRLNKTTPPKKSKQITDYKIRENASICSNKDVTSHKWMPDLVKFGFRYPEAWLERLHDNSRTDLKPEQYKRSGKLGMFEVFFIRSLYAGWTLLSSYSIKSISFWYWDSFVEKC